MIEISPNGKMKFINKQFVVILPTPTFETRITSEMRWN